MCREITMAVRLRLRAAHWIVAALALAPAWKAVEWATRPGPKQVTAEAVAAGRKLFTHEWKPGDPLAKGDGLGPVYNARSCLECHNQGGPGGGGPIERNVTVFGLKDETRGLPASGVVHTRAVSPSFQETLDLISPALPHAPTIPLDELLTDRPRRRLPGVVISQRNTPALFGDGLIDVVSDDTLIAHMRQRMPAARLVGLNRAKDPNIRGRIARLADGRLGRFGWKLEFATLEEFVKAACASELGLSSPGRPQATPLGKPNYRQPGNDLSAEQCVLMTDFIRGLPAPVQVWPRSRQEREKAERGQVLFTEIGCADCHVKDLGPVEGIYSDNLLHDVGVELESGAGYHDAILPRPAAPKQVEVTQQPMPGEWRTAPLWGVADSAPYLHDGRAATLEEAIRQHGGEAVGVVSRFQASPAADRDAIVAFLETLRAPRVPGGPTDTRVAAQ
jgi:CxxC motif-containing protein (DUF1111 family)